MKITLFDRFLLTLLTLITFMASLVILGISAGLIDLRSTILSINKDFAFTIATVATGSVLLLISLRLFFVGFSKGEPKSSVLRITNLGSIKVSLTALDNIVQKAVRSFDEVKDVNSIIISEPDGIRIILKIVIMPDVRIPDLTSEIQVKVKEYVENLSGIAVKEVQVNVDNLVNSVRSKVQ